VWSSEIDGRVLHFHLAGINNQNFLMQDEETGSWWQQVSGAAIHGPLAGRRLALVPHDEITFARFRAEQPHGQVLRPEDSAPWRRFSEDWEAGTAKLPVSPRIAPKGSPLPPRAVVLGVEQGGEAVAFPWDDLARTSPIVDEVGGVPLILVLATDGRSVRGFDRRVEGHILTLFAKAGDNRRLIDAETGSTWDFRGQAVAGPLAGKSLARLPLLKDYWFDWKIYHPQTRIFAAHGR
jgi:hypothetical protein